MYCVYKHTCPNGKVYIGITGLSPARRWQRGKNYISNTYFYRAIEKYGWDNIKHEILFESLTKEEASNKEIELIAFYRSDKRDFGYNICHGGEINIPSEETRLKMGNSRRGKKRSVEARLNMSKAAMGKPGTRTGKHHSEEAKKRISAKQQKTKVYQYTRYGKFISEYESVSEAARQTNIGREAITSVMNPDNFHKSTKGFIFTKEMFKMTNYQEILMNVKKELTNQRNDEIKLKQVLEDFNEAIADLQSLITTEQVKVKEILKPIAVELDQIKTLLPKKFTVPDIATLEATKLDYLLSPNLLDSLANNLNTLTLIINIKLEEN